MIYRTVVDHPCFSSGWENSSRSQSEKERGDEQEKSAAGQKSLLIAVGSTQLLGAVHGSRAAFRWSWVSDSVLHGQSGRDLDQPETSVR